MPAEQTIAIRPATEADLDQALTLYHEFHEFHVRGVPDRLRVPVPYDDAAARATLCHMLQSHDAALFVADDAGHLVGLAEVYLHHDAPHAAAIPLTYGHLQSLVVTERLRGTGLGRRLVAASEQWASERGATEMRLACWEFAGGPLPFYEALGYHTIKRTLARPLPHPPADIPPDMPHL